MKRIKMYKMHNKALFFSLILFLFYTRAMNRSRKPEELYHDNNVPCERILCQAGCCFLSSLLSLWACKTGVCIVPSSIPLAFNTVACCNLAHDMRRCMKD